MIARRPPTSGRGRSILGFLRVAKRFSGFNDCRLIFASRTPFDRPTFSEFRVTTPCPRGVGRARPADFSGPGIKRSRSLHSDSATWNGASRTCSGRSEPVEEFASVCRSVWGLFEFVKYKDTGSTLLRDLGTRIYWSSLEICFFRILDNHCSYLGSRTLESQSAMDHRIDANSTEQVHRPSEIRSSVRQIKFIDFPKNHLMHQPRDGEIRNVSFDLLQRLYRKPNPRSSSTGARSKNNHRPGGRRKTRGRIPETVHRANRDSRRNMH